MLRRTVITPFVIPRYMSKKLLIVNGSPRKDGVDARIAKMIAETAGKYDYTAEIVDICSMDIGGCKACMSCKKTGECAQKDDMTQMYAKIRESDMIVLASPIYFAAETGQMKCFIDRFYAMVKNVDGQRFVNFGNVKKGSILLTCGAPDGAMIYGSVLARLTNVIKSMGVQDLSGTVIPGIGPDEVAESDMVKDYIEGIEFQLEMD